MIAEKDYVWKKYKIEFSFEIQSAELCIMKYIKLTSLCESVLLKNSEHAHHSSYNPSSTECHFSRPISDMSQESWDPQTQSCPSYLRIKHLFHK